MLRLIADIAPIDPASGLALDEALLVCAQNSKHDVLRLWVNDRAAVIGRSQSAASEVNLDYAAVEHIPVLRRISGGGAVYHYPGNLNLSLVIGDARSLGGVTTTYQVVGEALVHALRRVGIDSRVDTNAIMIDEKKIAGAAQVRRGTTLLYHTTLLVHPPALSLPRILRAMNPSYSAKFVPSRPREVAFLSQIFPRTTMEQLSLALARPISNLVSAPAKADECNEEEIAHAARLKREKYGSDQWNLYR